MSAGNSTESLSPNCWPKSERPRERILALGPESLSLSELFAVILGHGHRGRPLFTLSQALACRWGPGFDVRGLPGIGDTARARILASLELGRRFMAARGSEIRAIRTSRHVVDLVSPRLAGLPRESFLTIPVDVKNRPLAVEEIARGTSDAVTFSPKDVFAAALAHQAHGFICAHNHPSGDPTPSSEDRILTNRLEEGAKLIGLRFLDHVILAGEGYFSFADARRARQGSG
ncbi:MAG: DNA repair protein RadC [Pseudomonadota bacterium]